MAIMFRHFDFSYPVQAFWLWLSCLELLTLAILFRTFGFLVPKTLKWFGFQHTWWRLFQKRVVRTNFDIYVFIIRVKEIVASVIIYQYGDKLKQKGINRNNFNITKHVIMILLLYNRQWSFVSFHSKCRSNRNKP